jgi:hypothetical protein
MTKTEAAQAGLQNVEQARALLAAADEHLEALVEIMLALRKLRDESWSIARRFGHEGALYRDPVRLVIDRLRWRARASGIGPRATEIGLPVRRDQPEDAAALIGDRAVIRQMRQAAGGASEGR